eukprot:TRINITY_DN11182_c0_g1_i2.p1 TRINITY_DN11182_c0_g1~~TRINITY_DN11182_c0_g1_i2.p1  ORF type:complete len:388 (+),score=73.10 TRINITY_DN11182_c0_g1_i2:80-1243(+)
MNGQAPFYQVFLFVIFLIAIAAADTADLQQNANAAKDDVRADMNLMDKGAGNVSMTLIIKNNARDDVRLVNCRDNITVGSGKSVNLSLQRTGGWWIVPVTQSWSCAEGPFHFYYVAGNLPKSSVHPDSMLSIGWGLENLMEDSSDYYHHGHFSSGSASSLMPKQQQDSGFSPTSQPDGPDPLGWIPGEAYYAELTTKKRSSNFSSGSASTLMLKQQQDSGFSPTSQPDGPDPLGWIEYYKELMTNNKSSNFSSGNASAILLRASEQEDDPDPAGLIDIYSRISGLKMSAGSDSSVFCGEQSCGGTKLLKVLPSSGFEVSILQDYTTAAAATTNTTPRLRGSLVNLAARPLRASLAGNRWARYDRRRRYSKPRNRGTCFWCEAAIGFD